METRFANLISYLFHPLLMPLFGTLIILNSGGYIAFAVQPALKLMVYGIVFLNTFIIPGAISILLVKKGVISSLSMPTAKERRFPFLLTALFFYFTYFVLAKTPLPPVLYLLILGATLSVLLTMIINFSWKISAHMVGIGGLVGAVISISMRFMMEMHLLIILLIICAGLTGFARLKLKAHHPAQVYAGFFLGFFCQWWIIMMA